MKVCIECEIEKPEGAFDFHDKKDGTRRNQCHSCIQKYRKEYCDKNKAKIKEKRKIDWIENKEKRQTINRTQYLKDRESRLVKAAIYRTTHKEEIKAWRYANREKLNHPDNPETKRAYVRHRMATDPIYRIRHDLRGSVWSALKARRKKKATQTFELIGTSPEKAWLHLKSQFTIGMNFENQGYYGWQKDHIIPLDSFDLSDLEEQKKAFHYTNMQPLWWVVNSWKGNKILSPEETDRLQKLKHLAWDPIKQQVITMAEWLDIWNNYKL